MEYENLLAVLNTIQLSNTNDRLIWKLENKGSFSVKSYYNYLAGHNRIVANSFPAKMIWRANAPTKISFLTWEASKERILTADNLMKRGFYLLNRCYLCKNNGETSNHLLLWCPITHKLWTMVYSLLDISWVMAGSVLEELFAWDLVWRNKKLRLIPLTIF